MPPVISRHPLQRQTQTTPPQSSPPRASNPSDAPSTIGNSGGETKPEEAKAELRQSDTTTTTGTDRFEPFTRITPGNAPGTPNANNENKKNGAATSNFTIPSGAPQKIATTKAGIVNQLKRQITNLQLQNHVILPQKTPAQEAGYNRLLQATAKKILNTKNTPRSEDTNIIYVNKNGVSHNTTRTLHAETGAKQETLFNSAVLNIYNQHIAPAGRNQKALQQLATDDFESDQTVKHSNISTADENSQNEEPIAALIGDAAGDEVPVSPSAGQTPSSNIPETGGIGSGNEIKETPPTTNQNQTPAANDSTKTKSEEKQNNEEQGIWKGYVGTKLGVGATLLAAGIALKLTLIGIVPGLIMAGVGAAIMAWGGANYLFNDNDKKPEEKAPAASS